MNNISDTLCKMYYSRLAALRVKGGPVEGVEWVVVVGHAQECPACKPLLDSILAEKRPDELKCSVARVYRVVRAAA